MNYTDTLALKEFDTIVDVSDSQNPRFAMVESLTKSVVNISWGVDGPKESRLRNNFTNFVTYDQWQTNA